jgi:MerR family transcriptional regulator, heat shock protein HspR
MPSLPLDNEDLPLFTVGQVSQMLEIQQAFLRRLDDFGVVSPSRSAGRQRRYTRREITVVQYVANLAEEGMTLAAIRRVLELEQRVQELEQQVGELGAQRDVLRSQRDAVRAERDKLRTERNDLAARLSRLTGPGPA